VSRRASYGFSTLAVNVATTILETEYVPSKQNVVCNEIIVSCTPATYSWFLICCDRDTSTFTLSMCITMSLSHTLFHFRELTTSHEFSISDYFAVVAKRGVLIQFVGVAFSIPDEVWRVWHRPGLTSPTTEICDKFSVVGMTRVFHHKSF